MNNPEQIKEVRMEMLTELQEEARKKKLSIEVLAERCDIRASTINKILEGQFCPSLDVYISIKQAVELPI